MKKSVRKLMIFILESSVPLWRKHWTAAEPEGCFTGVCDVHRFELTPEPPCEVRLRKRQQESGERDISREKYGKAQWRKDGFNSVYKPWPFNTFEKMWVTPERVVLHLRDTHDWCTESCLLRWALKFMGCSLDLQFYFPSPNEIRE